MKVLKEMALEKSDLLFELLVVEILLSSWGMKIWSQLNFSFCVSQNASADELEHFTKQETKVLMVCKGFHQKN